MSGKITSWTGGKRGSDGQSADTMGRPPKTSVQGKPILMTATTQCDHCGTSDIISGRPGTKIWGWECRTCKTYCKANGGAGFTFWCQN